MVLEVFAALSLAANIVQFVDFGGKLFSKARQVHHSKDGSSNEYADLEAATKSLKRLMDNLSSSITAISVAENISDDEKELVLLAKDCTEFANEFLPILERVKAHGRRSKWESFLQAIRITWNEKDINLAKDRLKQFQTRMTVYVLTVLK